MARFEKIKAHSIGRLFQHNNRSPNDGVEHENKEIDNERTYLNYHLKKGTPQDVTTRLSEIFHTGRKDQTVLGEICVTLPKDVKPEDERDFFTAVYNFYCNDFGKENVINAVVHKDETKPHIHFSFVPVIKSELSYSYRHKLALAKWKEEHNHETGEVERLCCNDLITRDYLSNMHSRLSDYVSSQLGYECEILNGATLSGNKSVLELKVERLRKELEEIEAQKEVLQREIKAVTLLAEKNGMTENDIGFLPLILRIDDLDNQNRVYREIITRQRYSYSKEELDRLKERKYISSLYAKVNAYDGKLYDVENLFFNLDNIKAQDINSPEYNSIIICETYWKDKRPLPLQKALDKDEDFYRAMRMASVKDTPIVVKASRTSNRTYIFVKTDNTQQTIEHLLLLQAELSKEEYQNRNVYMERMTNDDYDFAKLVLEKANQKSYYFTGRETADERIEREKTAQKETETQ